jgi:hypothetical protein
MFLSEVSLLQHKSSAHTGEKITLKSFYILNKFQANRHEMVNFSNLP